MPETYANVKTMADLDADQPVGTEAPSAIDDSIRAVKLALLNSLSWSLTTKTTGTYTPTLAEGGVWKADTSGGDVQFDIESINDIYAGKELKFIKSDTANSMIINPGAKTINGDATNLTISGLGTVILIYDGTNFLRFDRPKRVFDVVADYGADPTGVTDSSTAIQTAIDDSANNGFVYCPQGFYRLDTGLTVTSSYTKIIGSYYPTHISTAYDTAKTIGSVFDYRGSGTALTVSATTDFSTGEYLTGVDIQDIQILVTQNTNLGMHVWHPLGSTFKRIMVFGNSDNDYGTGEVFSNDVTATSHNAGVFVQASLNCLFERIDIRGQGVGDTAGSTKYLGRGLSIGSGNAGTACTTTTFRQIYAHYCKTGIFVGSIGDFDGCISEANSKRALYFTTDCDAHFTNFYSEGCPTIFYSSAANRLIFEKGIFDISTNQQFFDMASGLGRYAFNNCSFTSTHASPIVMKASTFTTPEVRFRQPWFSNSSTTLFGAGLTNGGYDQVKIIDMDIVKYSFYVAALTNGRAEANMGCLGTTGGNHTSFELPNNGNLLGFTTTFKGVAYSGSYGIDIHVGGASKIDLNGQSGDVNRVDNYLNYPFSSGDVLEVKLETSVGFPNGTGDMLVEVYVALGDDGL